MIVGKGSVWGLVVWQMRAVALFAISATAVVGLHVVLRWQWLRIPALPIAVVGGALGIFVSFRTNAAYTRWWEGRQLWGRLVNNSRMFATQVLTYLPESAPRRALVYRQILYVHVLRCLLRDQDPWVDGEVVRFTSEEEREALARENRMWRRIVIQTPQHMALPRKSCGVGGLPTSTCSR